MAEGAGTIIVGAGPAGAVLAARLVAAGERVLLIEAGPDYGPFGSPAWPTALLDPTRMPVDDVSWNYRSAAQHGQPDHHLQRARVIGGCSAHNGAAALWGHRADYDAWAEENPGWNADDLLPLFEAVNEQLRVHVPPADWVTPFHRYVIEAVQQAGYPIIPDLSSLDPEFGFSIHPVNIDPATRIRWHAAFAYLDDLRDDPNFTLAPDTIVDRVILEGGRAVSVAVIGPAGPAELRADRIILAGGAYGTPLILLRSGIGPADKLAAWGIPLQRDLPGVGENLHDHPAAAVLYEASPEMMAEMDAFVAAGGLAREEGTTGLVSSSRCEGPYDTHIYPVAPHPHGDEGWRFAIAAAVMAPRSRGSISLNPDNPADPEAAPVIDTNYLSDAAGYDLDVLAEAVERSRELAAQPALAAVLVREIAPGPEVTTRDDIKAWLLANATHDYHPAGTCRMGPASDPSSVVDASGHVHGVPGLMVVDASIMPFVTLANTNMPVFAIAEKFARDLLTLEPAG